MKYLWQRYLFREVSLPFLFFTLVLFVAYATIDYFTQSHTFFQGDSIPVGGMLLYYFFQFIKRLDILLPLSLLLATVHTLHRLNVQKELTAFQVAGIKPKKLLAPFFLLATLCSLSLFAVNEFALPKALNYIDSFAYTHLRHSFRGKRNDPFRVLHLADRSRLAYQTYDRKNELFSDVLWIRSSDDIWRMKALKADHDDPQGIRVDHLVRNDEGAFEKVESATRRFFPDLKWSKDLPKRGFIPFENRSLTSLWQSLHEPITQTLFERGEILSHLLFKLTMPLFPLLIVLAAAPFCLTVAARARAFALFGFSLFGFVTFIALTDACVILGENQTASPYFAILSPFIVLLAVFGVRYAKVR